LLSEFYGIEISGSLKFAISSATLILFVVYAHLKPLHVFQPIFNWIAEGMANVNELIDWALVPIILPVKIFFKAVAFISRRAFALLRYQSFFASQPGELTFDRPKESKYRGGGEAS
jgi:hypothetical protein